MEIFELVGDHSHVLLVSNNVGKSMAVTLYRIIELLKTSLINHMKNPLQKVKCLTNASQHSISTSSKNIAKPLIF